MTTSPLIANFFLHGKCFTLLTIFSLDSSNHFFGPILTISFQLCPSLLQQLPPECHPSQQIPMKNNFSVNAIDTEPITYMHFATKINTCFYAHTFINVEII